MTVQAGNYNYDFHCNLPAGLPTSLEADIGYIRYMARVVLDIPMWPDTEFNEVFTVIKPLNLNYDPTLRVSWSITCILQQSNLQFNMILFFYLVTDGQRKA